MRKFSKILMITMVALFLAAGSAFAVPVYQDGTGDLVDIFDDIGLTAAGYDVIDSQKTVPAFWKHSATGAKSRFVFSDVSDFWGTTAEFGIYSAATDQLVPLYTDTHQGSTSVDFLADGSLDVYGSGGYAVTADTSGFGNTFGFYITSDGGWADGTYYSDPTRNPGWTPTWDADDEGVYYDWMVFYRGATGVELDPYGGYAGGYFGKDDWLIAADGYPHGSLDNGKLDFTDTVILIESVKPIPEPATMLLLGAGLVGLAGLGRKKLFRKS